jgi:hypothetical protein
MRSKTIVDALIALGRVKDLPGGSPVSGELWLEVMQSWCALKVEFENETKGVNIDEVKE